MLEPRLKIAFKKALDQFVTQKEMERKTGVSQSTITHFLSGRRRLMNMSVATLEKLFPEMQITFFRDEAPVITSSMASAVAGDPVESGINQILKALTAEEKVEALMLLATHFGKKIERLRQ